MAEEIDKKALEKLLTVVKAAVNGDFSKEAGGDTSGIITQLTGEINHIVRILRDAAPAFSQTTDQASILANTAQNILEFMINSTKTTLHSTDLILNACDELDDALADTESAKGLAALETIKSKAFDIIAAQSYQDSARQQLESMENDLEQIRDTMIEALILMNLRSEKDPELRKSKQQSIIEGTEGESEEKKQDLVGELLAEFGL